MIWSAEEITSELMRLGISHVIWIPDSDLGQWESALESSPMELVRVCREGEAWPLAAGLLIGGLTPLIVMQTTGLFESGDALRNVIHDMQLPVFVIIGARNWLNRQSRDSAKTFAEPILKAWNFDYVTIESHQDRPRLGEHYRHCQEQHKPGGILLAE